MKKSTSIKRALHADKEIKSSPWALSHKFKNKEWAHNKDQIRSIYFIARFGTKNPIHYSSVYRAKAATRIPVKICCLDQ